MTSPGILDVGINSAKRPPGWLSAAIFLVMIYQYLQALINSRRGEITIWGAIGIIVLVLAYVTFPQVFEGFFDWVRNYFTDGLESMKEDKNKKIGPGELQQELKNKGKQ